MNDIKVDKNSMHEITEELFSNFSETNLSEYETKRYVDEKERSHSAKEVRTKKLKKIDKFSKHVFNLTNADFPTKMYSLKELYEFRIYPKNGQEANALIRALT